MTHHVGKIKSRCDAEDTCSPQEQKTIDAFGWNPGGIHRHESAKAYPDRFPTNRDSIGIEVVSAFNASTKTYDPPTAEQTASLKSLVGALTDHYGLDIDSDVYLHPEVSYKEADEARSLVYQ